MDRTAEKSAGFEVIMRWSGIRGTLRSAMLVDIHSAGDNGRNFITRATS
jgi:hypothetical protein